MKTKFLLASALLLALGATQQAFAGPNDFFGGTLPGSGGGSSGGASSGSSDSGGPAPGMPGAGDYSGDEKRMQKKYTASLKHAHGLVSKGVDMIRKGEASKDDKMAKKGKILKEIGEKRLSELEANNPNPNAQAKKDKPVQQ